MIENLKRLEDVDGVPRYMNVFFLGCLYFDSKLDFKFPIKIPNNFKIFKQL